MVNPQGPTFLLSILDVIQVICRCLICRFNFKSLNVVVPLTQKFLQRLKFLPLGGLVPSGAYIARPLLSAWFCLNPMGILKFEIMCSIQFLIACVYQPLVLIQHATLRNVLHKCSIIGLCLASEIIPTHRSNSQLVRLFITPKNSNTSRRYEGMRAASK